MSGHYPFAGDKGIRYGQAGRMSIAAFFEVNRFNQEIQEKYYKWWYDFAKAYVEKDADLSYSKGIQFNNYPMGTHSHVSFHLQDKYWCVCLEDLGALIRDLILTKLSDTESKKLEKDHHDLMDALKKEAETNTRDNYADVGYFRHI